MDNHHREQLLAEYYEPMFEQELAGWVTDRATQNVVQLSRQVTYGKKLYVSIWQKLHK